MPTVDPVISIIIPACNAERFLKECLESVINQSFVEWELIIADDGSTDATGEIADKYAAIDERICVIHTEKRGVSNARNTCLARSKGRYFTFVDADDYLEPQYLEELIRYASLHNADITQCSFNFVYANGRMTPDPYAVESLYSGSNEIMNSYFRGPVGDIRVSVWAKLFLRDAFADIRFDKDLRVFEDAYFIYQCCRKAVTVCSFTSPLYLYRQHDNSTMHSCLPYIYQDYFTMFEKQKNDYLNVSAVREQIVKREVNTALWLLSIMIIEDKKQELWNLRKIILGVIGSVFVPSFPIKLKLKVICLAVMPHLYFAMLERKVVSDNEKV